MKCSIPLKADFQLASPPDVVGNDLKVLVIEDDRPTRLLLQKIISERGHTVEACDSAETALEILSHEFFPLIVLDIQLPGISGLELSRLLRKHEVGAYYYILVGTGHNRPEDLKDILDAGANDYIAKPYHPGLFNIRLAVAESAVKEIAERRRLEGDLEFLAYHDPLTKLFNRRGLATNLQEAVVAARQGHPGALLYIDLDNFKIVNDMLGHDAGDRLLVTISGILRGATRKSDVLVRFGGDEFVIILPDCSTKDALTIGEGLREKIESIILIEKGRLFRVGASIGVTPIDGSKKPADILGLADAACYHAKSNGRNRVELHRETGSALAELVADEDWVARITAAMRNDALHIFFQPIVSTATRSIFCHEILLRLNDRSDALTIPPETFIPAVHRSGQSERLDRFVVTRAVEALQKNPAAHFSINISGGSYSNQDFWEFVENLFSKNHISPERIIFEVTENELISNLRQAETAMLSLHRKGFRFALDDFGSGASSLTYLKSLPIDLIKIDGTFIRKLDENPFNKAVVHAVKALAEALKIPVVAEYVERQSIYDVLMKLKVDYIQGYYIGIPRTTPYNEDELFKSAEAHQESAHPV